MEREKLFLTLRVAFPIVNDEERERLYKEGYLTNDKSFLNEKASAFIKQFIEEKKDIVYKLMKEYKNQDDRINKIKKGAGIKDSETFVQIAKSLERDGKVLLSSSEVRYSIND